MSKLSERMPGRLMSLDELRAEGLSPVSVAKLCSSGELERVHHGFYLVAGGDGVFEEALIARALPRAVVCLESALYHYGYGDWTPRAWSLAMPRGCGRAGSRMMSVPVKIWQMSDLDFGVTTGDFNSVVLPVTDRERTICDCFKYRNKLDAELTQKAFKGYAVDNQKNVSRLFSYAQRMHVMQSLRPVMEVLINE